MSNFDDKCVLKYESCVEDGTVVYDDGTLSKGIYIVMEYCP